MPTNPDAASPPRGEQTILLLRWALIIATAYVALFHRPLSETPPIVGLFVAFYLASNIAVGFLLRRVHTTRLFLIGIVLFDTLAVSTALLLTQRATTDFFLLYFVIMLIGTLSDSLASVLTTALLISIVHLYTVSHFLGFGELLQSGHLVQIPFLFLVGLFFGHLVQRARQAERETELVKAHHRAQSDFVAMFAHDIKSPLSAVLGYAELLREDESDEGPKRGELMDGMESAAQNAVLLAMNFVDAFRLDSGSLQLRRARSSLNEIVEHALQPAVHAARAKEVTIETALAADLPDLELDKRAFDRVVTNLLSNAIKFSPPGAAVRIATARRDGLVTLSVSDRGPGIPTQDQPKLFQRFTSLKNAQRDSTGLGLFIVKTITEAHGGRVRFECPREGGTVFEVSLPLPA